MSKQNIQHFSTAQLLNNRASTEQTRTNCMVTSHLLLCIKHLIGMTKGCYEQVAVDETQETLPYDDFWSGMKSVWHE